ncbi:MAG: L-histidine N(alpha)-methyltransferase [Streptosporangiales bacterium]|nr:L-histidine N(alpha)-methyltransferase [Streptosporangiales bacterium]
MDGAAGGFAGDGGPGGSSRHASVRRRAVSKQGDLVPVVGIERFLTDDDLAKTLRADVREGLLAEPKRLPPKWFYDTRGSELFEEITKLEEYYQTRAERAILVGRSAEIAAASRARTLVELGAGSAEKTRVLMDALRAAGTLDTYVPVDVSGEFLAGTAEAIATEYPGLRVHGAVADFERHLTLLPSGPGPALVALLGGTIGNLHPEERAEFLSGVRAGLRPGDGFLLGTDLVKDPARLVAAYDDAAGVTADFNRNVLRVIDHELGADFDPDAFTHVAVWDAEREWIEMRLRSVRDQRVRVEDLDLEVSFTAEEEMRTEISAKFRRSGLERELAAAGLSLVDWWTDPAGDFALSLSHPI